MSTPSFATRRLWSSFQSTKQTTEIPELQFYALLTDGTRDVRFRQLAVCKTAGTLGEKRITSEL
jgi:hypothetical protein